ncbi:UNVERIFIED_CONTAM: hypothetical protein Sradi_4548900 [Sesamum radiatum]|uniref:Uncharacterized protein n=1 Tax=Sesamum radiatum TaxID=300843 RepID=A0AAW2NA48_SESRA
MSTSAPPPFERGRQGQGHGRGPPSPPWAEPTDPVPATPSLEAMSHPPPIPADSGTVGSAAAGATSS